MEENERDYTIARMYYSYYNKWFLSIQSLMDGPIDSPILLNKTKNVRPTAVLL